jgi:hypothetical protein
MTILTMRYSRGHFIVSAPGMEPVKFKTRREARDWCLRHHRGSPLKEIGADEAKRAAKARAKAQRSKAAAVWRAAVADLDPTTRSSRDPNIRSACVMGRRIADRTATSRRATPPWPRSGKSRRGE